MSNSSCQEVWIEGPHGQSLCALINGESGWLMYLREPGDAGFSSRNPEYTGDPDARIDYELTNGQVDSYPAAWAYPVADIERAISYFRSEGRPAPFIVWHNDSNDGEPPGPRFNKSFKPMPHVSFTSRGEQFLLTDGSSHYIGDCVWGGTLNDCLTLVANTIRRTCANGRSAILLTEREQDDVAARAKRFLDYAGHDYRVVITRYGAETNER